MPKNYQPTKEMHFNQITNSKSENHAFPVLRSLSDIFPEAY